jgi:hypothetical protein
MHCPKGKIWLFFIYVKIIKFIHILVGGLCRLQFGTVLTSAEMGLRSRPSTNFMNNLGMEADLKT